MELSMNRVSNNLLTKRDEKIVKLELLRQFVRDFRSQRSSNEKHQHVAKKV